MTLHTRSLEWFLATMMFAWGIGLSVPGDTMSLPQYRILGEMAPEQLWAAFSLSFAISRYAALYINGAWRKSPLVRVFCAAFGVAFWITITYGFFQARTNAPMAAGLMWLPVLIGAEFFCVAGGMIAAYHSRAFDRFNQQ